MDFPGNISDGHQEKRNAQMGKNNKIKQWK
jgi:hypothetical protein